MAHARHGVAGKIHQPFTAVADFGAGEAAEGIAVTQRRDLVGCEIEAELTAGIEDLVQAAAGIEFVVDQLGCKYFPCVLEASYKRRELCVRERLTGAADLCFAGSHELFDERAVLSLPSA